MWHPTKMLRPLSFTFGSYKVDAQRSIVSFTYRVELKYGISKTFTDRLFFENVSPEAWEKIPAAVLEPTLQALLLMLGINYWCAFRTRNIRIEGFTLTRAQAQFWDSLYLNGLGEFFYLLQIDFRNLIAFPYDDSATAPTPTRFERPARALLLNGAGKDSILSAEILKASGTPFDFFAFAPTPAHERIAKLVGAKTIRAKRQRDPWIKFILSGAYPSVSTFTFIATLLAELLGYNSIIFSNERSSDFGNLNYLGLEVNHQWCKSSEAEKMISDYIQSFITPDISTRSLLRQYSELEIVRRFVRYPQYLYDVTSCNSYFCMTRIEQRLARRNYWCNRCPKCVFLFACFSAFLPKKEVVGIFGADLYRKRRLLPLFKRILGIEGFKPLDCVGEPGEMILAMHYAAERKEYSGEPAMQVFEKHFPPTYDFMPNDKLRKVYNKIAGAYLNHQHSNWDDDYISKFKELTKPGGKILDLGCGPGLESKMFQDAGFDIFGFDLSDAFIELAEKQAPRGHFQQGDMTQLPYESEFFDGVFAKASLLHIPKSEMPLVLAEINRVLKKDGILHIAVKKGEGEREVVDSHYGQETERFYSFWDNDEIKKEVMKANYELIAESSYIRPGGKTTWLKLLFRKISQT